jgi:predicted O-methyltransferase YrrM
MNGLTAENMLALARNFMECRILLSAAELDLFTLLAREPLTAGEVTKHLKGDERAVTILLDAAAAMGFLKKHGGRYRCEPDIAALLSADAPESVLAMVLHSAALWPSWAELTGMARGDAAARTRALTPRGDTSQRAFIGAMHVVGRGRAAAMVAAIDPGPARALLDVGGASGTYTIAFLTASPQLKATLFDLPPVIEMARERIGAAGLADRVRLVAGDFDTDELPGGHDLVLLSAIIHQNSPRQNVELYRKVWRALAPGGRLVIRDHVMSPDRTDPREGAVFAVNMLVRTAGGSTYTFEEISDGLVEAGFERVRLLQRGGGMTGLVEAFKPAR